MASASSGKDQKLDSGATRFLERRNTGSGSKKRLDFKGVRFQSEEEAVYPTEPRSDVATTQLEVTPITIVATETALELRQQIATNESLICYALKQGHIRVLHKHSSERLLLKAHQQYITDLRFHPPARNVPASAEATHHMLASASRDGIVAVWQLTERRGTEPGISQSYRLKICMLRKSEDMIRSLSWCPTVKDVLALAVGPRVLFCACKHAEQPDLPIEETLDCDPQSADLPRCMAALPASLLGDAIACNITSVDFSPDGSRLAVGGGDGQVRIVRLAQGIDSPDALLERAQHASAEPPLQPFRGEPPGSLAWLGHNSGGSVKLLVGNQSNSMLSIWDSAQNAISHTLHLQNASPGGQPPFNHIALVPEARLLIMANVRWAAMYVSHLSEDFSAFSSLMEFRTKPTLSIASWWQAANATIQLYCIQPDAIQQYTLRPEQCLPQDGSLPPESGSLPQPVLSNGSPAPAPSRSTSIPQPAAAAPQQPATAAAAVQGSLMQSPGLVQGNPQGLTVQTAASGGGASALGAPPSPSGLQQPQLITPTMLRHRVAGSRTSSQASSVFSEILRDEDARGVSAHASRPDSPHVGTEPSRPEAVQPSPASKGTAPTAAGASPAPGASAAAPEPAPPGTTSLSSPFDSSAISQVKILKRPGSMQQRPPLAPEAPRPTPPASLAPESLAGPFASGSQADTPTVILPATPPPPSLVPAERPTSAAAPRLEAPAPDAAAQHLHRAASEASSSGSHDGGQLSDGMQSTGATPARPAQRAATEDSQMLQLQKQLAAVLQQLQASRTETKQLVDGMQKKLSQQAAAAEQRSLKSVRDEVKKEGKRLEAVHAAEVARMVKVQAKTIQEERKVLLAEEHANIEKLLSSISASVNRDLPQRLEDLIKAQLAALPPPLAPSALQPAVQAALAAALPLELAGSALQGALERSLGTQLKAALRQPLQEGFRASFQHHLIPAFEAACQDLFSQVQATFAGGLAEHLQAAGGANASVANSLQTTLGQAQSMAQLLARDVAEGQRQLIRLASEHEAAGAAKRAQEAAAQPPVDPKVQLLHLVKEERFEEAFNQVLHIGDVDLVDWLCGQVEPSDLFSREPVPLSQGVLLSLVSQLSTDLTQDTAGKLGWMREATPAIDPHDELFAPHMRPILQALVARLRELSTRLQGPNASQCRTVSHLVNSILHQLAY